MTELTIEEAETLLVDVIAEARQEIATDRWCLLPNERMIVAAYAAAGLSHACYLADELMLARRRDSELVGRMVARALFETWIVTYYVQLGGLEALIDLNAAYAYELRAQRNGIRQQEEETKARIRRAKRRNRSIRKQNEHLAKWNAEHADERPKPLVPPVEVPPRANFGIDDSVFDPPSSAQPARLTLMEMIERLGPLTAAKGQEQRYHMAYQLTYRLLSSLASHTNMWVLSTYVDDRAGRSVFVRIRDHAWVSSSFADANLTTALIFVAGLTDIVFGERDISRPAAQRALDRIAQT